MFVNRRKEIKRITAALHQKNAVLIVIYGRRRCGKSTLLKKVISGNDIYFAADLREKSLQIEAFAKSVERMVPGFAKLRYPDWDALFHNLKNTLNEKITLCIDEFPYLVKNAPELPSLLQNIIDNKINDKYNLILCGSSQQMMQNITLNSSSPLYGRCDEILNVKPMLLGWYNEYFRTNAIETIEGYSVFGGVPRYWELQKKHPSLAGSIKYNLLDPDGVLFKEPETLFHDEMRTSVLAFSILTLIGLGCNRLSEIAGRLEKPATQLNRPIKLLIDLGYIRRETPFNTSLKSTKKSLYKISDPFMNFYFSFIVPNKSRLEFGLIEQVWNEINGKLNQYVSEQWEELCRNAVPRLKIKGKTFSPAQRWWGKGIDRKPMELDVVAESTDKSTLLIGEVKWMNNISVRKILNELKVKTENAPFIQNRKLIHVLFLKQRPVQAPNEIMIITPADIIAVLK
ncbi:MAG: ATP-binding protein [Deltaproteobacteria bacterium]|nr:ATP-binding protein [Deltaproteobacteria bacterium]